MSIDTNDNHEQPSDEKPQKQSLLKKKEDLLTEDVSEESLGKRPKESPKHLKKLDRSDDEETQEQSLLRNKINSLMEDVSERSLVKQFKKSPTLEIKEELEGE